MRGGACERGRKALTSARHARVSCRKAERDEFQGKLKDWRAEMSDAGRDPKHAFMYETADLVEYREEKKKDKKPAAFGWDGARWPDALVSMSGLLTLSIVFNQETTYKAYERRVEALHPEVRRQQSIKRASERALPSAPFADRQGPGPRDDSRRQLARLPRGARVQGRRRQHDSGA